MIVKPQIASIIKADIFARAAFLIICISWISYALTILYPFLPEQLKGISPLTSIDEPYYLKSALMFTAFVAPVLGSRIIYIFYIFANGIQVDGIISTLRHERSSKLYLIVSHEYTQQTYSTRHIVPGRGKFKSLHEGGTIAMIVNKKNPKQAVIRDRFV